MIATGEKVATTRLTGAVRKARPPVGLAETGGRRGLNSGIGNITPHRENFQPVGTMDGAERSRAMAKFA
jgi:hypothetical protein